MPNWVTTKVQAASHVIRAMLNSDDKVDFSAIAPFQGPCGAEWEGIHLDAEGFAKTVAGFPLSSDPMIASLERLNRSRVSIKTMDDEGFEQFIGMLRNFRACGFLHGMDFANHAWGTKWNACRSIAAPNEGWCQFETAWACPVPALEKLSARFPDEEIVVTFADEDIGSNCGTLTLKSGNVVARDVSPGWQGLDDAGWAKWRAFARSVIGQASEEDGDA